MSPRIFYIWIKLKLNFRELFVQKFYKMRTTSFGWPLPFPLLLDPHLSPFSERHFTFKFMDWCTLPIPRRLSDYIRPSLSAVQARARGVGWATRVNTPPACNQTIYGWPFSFVCVIFSNLNALVLELINFGNGNFQNQSHDSSVVHDLNVFNFIIILR